MNESMMRTGPVASLKSVTSDTKRITNLSSGLSKSLSGIDNLDPTEASKLDAILTTIRQSLGEAIKLVGEAATVDMQ